LPRQYCKNRVQKICSNIISASIMVRCNSSYASVTTIKGYFNLITYKSFHLGRMTTLFTVFLNLYSYQNDTLLI